MNASLAAVPDPVYIVTDARAGAQLEELGFSALVIDAPIGAGDFIAIAGRLPILIPDAGQPSRALAARHAASLVNGGMHCRVFDPSGMAADWHLSAIRTADELRSLPLREMAPNVVTLKPKAAKAVADETTREKWRDLGLILQNGKPIPNIDNALRAMTASTLPIWWDEFLQRGMIEWNTDTRELRDADFVDLTIWMQRDLEIRTISLRTVTAAAESYLRQNVRNCAQQWLHRLLWDGVPRLSCLAVDGFGTADDEYHRSVLRCFIMGMVKRILEPGCQVDNVPVFESPEGRRKSSALRILGGKWFAECHEEITGKDFLQIMPGKMLLEVAELHSFRRADIERIKGIITNRIDRYRASYGRTAQDHPRMCVMAGTTNRDDWNNSDTGARRFWPIICGIIDLDWLAANREQLFAEAASRVMRGEPHWDVPADAARLHVKARQAGDAWDGLIERYCDVRKDVNVEEIMRDCLEIEKSRANNADAGRVRTILRRMEWTMKSTSRDGKSCWRWFPPATVDKPSIAVEQPAPPSPAPEPVIDNSEFDPDVPF